MECTAGELSAKARTMSQPCLSSLRFANLPSAQPQPSTSQSFCQHYWRSAPVPGVCHARPETQPPLRLRLSKVTIDSWPCPRHSSIVRNARFRRRDICPAAIAAETGADGRTFEPLASTRPSPKALSSFTNRLIYGAALGVAGALIIFAGGWVFTTVTCLVVYQISQEFYGFVTSKGISAGMQPPPPGVSALTSAMCIGLSAWTFVSRGRSTAALAVSSFAVLSLQLLTVEKPRFSQLASSVFGLFYCGYLPSFWVKLRLLSVPAVSSTAVHRWPVMLGGVAHWTVGLLATTMAVACIVAADTGAYFCGKALGRTQLISISPMKTVEGALGGMLCSCACALGFCRFLAWPAHPAVAVALGFLVFVASLFGDLLESVMKREAGLKDAGNLIPGHGGLLDRIDSYVFTGAIVFFVVYFVLPLYGL